MPLNNPGSAAAFRFLCGVDVGGTFTDLVLVDVEQGRVLTEKVPTTAADPSDAIVAGLAALRQRLSAAEGASPLRLVHATTLVTNALIERKGARVGLLTTDGFRDVLDFQRENRFDIFDLAIRFPLPLVPLAMRWEVAGRVDADGCEVLPLDAAAVRRAAAEMKTQGVESVAIAFLHAWATPAQEQAAAKELRQVFPTRYVSLSGEVAPLIREYERFSTATVNAYVMPLVDSYLAQLGARVDAVWPRTTLSLMVSNGGICSPETARDFPVRLLESGPVAGALVAAHFGKLAGWTEVLAFDMGGTTAKLCVVREGAPTMVAQFEADRTSRFKRGSGLPILVPSVDLVEIGAGGGSIAWIDDLGLLQVGPRSASARPGPACYGHGGAEPTVTDADLVLGYLNPAYFLGGRMPLDVVAAGRALQDRIAQRLDVTVEQAAWGIHELVNENMASAAWLHMAEKGLDPRSYVLVATGGAGPVHACHIAVKLGIARVLYPPASGVASAFGSLIAPPKADVAHSFISGLETLDFDRLATELAALEEQAAATLVEAGVPRSEVRFARMADMLYRGQTHHIEVRLPEGGLRVEDQLRIAQRFHDAYYGVYGTNLPESAIDMVALRVTGIAAAAEMATDLFAPIAAASTTTARRPMYIAAAKEMREVAVIRREDLKPGVVVDGPALVESPDTTIVVDPGWRIHCLATGALLLEHAARAMAGKD